MIKFNRTTEYGLMALRHMNQKQSVTSAREIADRYGLPFEITAKTLQRLRDTGWIESAQGARGGYLLKARLGDITLAEFLYQMEGPQSVVMCTPAPVPFGLDAPTAASCACEYEGQCEIKNLMSGLNRRVHQFLSGIRLSEITEGVQDRSSVGFFVSPGVAGTDLDVGGGEP